MADFDWFEIFPIERGSGRSRRISFYVKVRQWIVPDGAEELAPMCLSADADDPEEFDALVDELIDELEKLKMTARRKWAKAGSDGGSSAGG